MKKGLTRSFTIIAALGLMALLVMTGAALADSGSCSSCKDTPLTEAKDMQSLAAADKEADGKTPADRSTVIMLAENCPNPNCKSITLDDLFSTGLAFAPESAAPAQKENKAVLVACDDGNGNGCKSITPENLLGSEVRVAMALPFEGSGAAYGFSSNIASSSASKAFAAGLWEAREGLTGKKLPEPLPASLAPSTTESSAGKWRESGFNDYYRLGWWVMNLQAVCHFGAELPKGFWNAEIEAVSNARSTFAGRSEPEAKILPAILDGLTPVFQQLAEDPGSLRACKTLQSEIERLTQQMAPSDGV